MIKWKLNEVMAAKRVTNRALSQAIGIHENSVSRLRLSDKMPRISEERLDAICKALDCQPGDLLERKEVQNDD